MLRRERKVFLPATVPMAILISILVWCNHHHDNNDSIIELINPILMQVASTQQRAENSPHPQLFDISLSISKLGRGDDF